MHQAARAYQQTSRSGLSGRELEATVLSQCASELDALSDLHPDQQTALTRAVGRNTDLWHILAESATSPSTDLPRPASEQIARTAAMVFAMTRRLVEQPNRGDIARLVKINRELAAGLRTRAS